MGHQGDAATTNPLNGWVAFHLTEKCRCFARIFADDEFGKASFDALRDKAIRGNMGVCSRITDTGDAHIGFQYYPRRPPMTESVHAICYSVARDGNVEDESLQASYLHCYFLETCWQWPKAIIQPIAL